MFNKNMFNRNAFNRSVSLSNISIPMISTNSLTLQLIVRVMISHQPFAGSSTLTCKLIMKQSMSGTFSGSSEVKPITTVLGLRLPSTIVKGTGSFAPRISVATPFKGSFNGNGAFGVNNKIYFIQSFAPTIPAGGTLETKFVMQTPITINLSGGSSLKSTVTFPIPMAMDIMGFGEMPLRRLSAIDESILELIDINLLPGEVVTIDTDLLQVLFGSIEDVSAVTSDSVFFELNPGENEILISTDSVTTLDVTAIWQNRWL